VNDCGGFVNEFQIASLNAHFPEISRTARLNKNCLTLKKEEPRKVRNRKQWGVLALSECKTQLIMRSSTIAPAYSLPVRHGESSGMRTIESQPLTAAPPRLQAIAATRPLQSANVLLASVSVLSVFSVVPPHRPL